MKNWMIAGAVVAGLGIIMFLSDRPVKTAEGLDLIRNPSQYAAANNKAAELAQEAFQKNESGQPLTDQDKKNLQEAVKYFNAMQNFEPRRVQPLFGAGMAYMILGEKEKASERFQQAINDRDLDPDRDAPAIKLTVIQAYALQSEVTLDLAAQEVGNFNSFLQSNDKKAADEAKKRSEIFYAKALDNANRAVQAQPEGTRYLVDRGNVFLALGKKEMAIQDFRKAKSLAPEDPRVKMATKLVGI